MDKIKPMLKAGVLLPVLQCIFDLKFNRIHLTQVMLKVWIINRLYVINVPVCEVERRCLRFRSRREYKVYIFRMNTERWWLVEEQYLQ